jgi:thiol-disulfide isomerase/thioredoxin
MRLDPKFFNLFIAICAVLTVVVIIFTTIRYSQKQVDDFRENIAAVQLDTLSFKSYSTPDSLRLQEILGNPVIIHFWSTWSDKSKQVNEFLHDYSKEHSSLVIVAAAVRDGEQQIKDYIKNSPFQFHFVEGTEFYQTVFVPGMPSQILISSGGKLFATNIGDDTSELKEQLNSLLLYED